MKCPLRTFEAASQLFFWELNQQWLIGKEFSCQSRRRGFDPWVRKIPWRRKWQLTPVFLAGKSHGQRSLIGSTGLQRGGHDLVTKQQQFFSTKNYLKIWGMLKSVALGVISERQLWSMVRIYWMEVSLILLYKVYEQKGSQLRRQQRETQSMRNWLTGLLGENLWFVCFLR